MPVQRIPRYKLLLEDLLKKTVETHPDYLNLKKAYQVIENVATFVNETIRQHEMFINMLDIQKSLTGFDEVLLVPGRTFIKRGIVKKVQNYLSVYLFNNNINVKNFLRYVVENIRNGNFSYFQIFCDVI